jgi:putative phage-type endonuclease
MIIHDIKQRSDEWFAIKRGKMGASHAQAIASQGKGLETYLIELMSEYYSIAPKENYTNEHIERGNELEAQARAIYELETGNEVEEVGFIELDEYVGCSPDGLVGEDGLIEIKCPSDKVYFQYLLDRKIDTGYMWQMQMQMLICQRKWCDYVCYNPNFEKSIVIARVIPSIEEFAKLEKGFEIARARIDEISKTISEGAKNDIH